MNKRNPYEDNNNKLLNNTHSGFGNGRFSISIQTNILIKDVFDSTAIGIIDKRSNYIILDFGTATTFDVIIKDKYLGGVIAPGVNLSLKTLSSKAKLIPKIKLSKNI